ncbi:hypothetical protein BJY04DRAFT_96507 [Aspergillus karnatakaensis]|uniref:uncharacterized protein n=1 Tax=Aspergillus karnatakaensis TaxID=1810916 RepID=UPI003CCDB654
MSSNTSAPQWNWWDEWLQGEYSYATMEQLPELWNDHSFWKIAIPDELTTDPQSSTASTGLHSGIPGDNSLPDGPFSRSSTAEDATQITDPYMARSHNEVGSHPQGPQVPIATPKNKDAGGMSPCDGPVSPEAKSVFKCDWKDCTYAGVFSREGELIRHVKTKHVTPKSYKCTASNCDRVCSRKDNLAEHVRRIHGARDTLPRDSGREVSS